MTEKPDSGKLLKDLLTENWKEVFLVDGINDKQIHYSEFFSMVLRGKEQLQKYGLKENDIICLFLHNSLEFLILLFSSLLLQLTVVPIDVTKGKTDIQEILNAMRYSIVIHDKEIDSVFNKIHINDFTSSLNQQHESDFSQLDIFTKVNYDKLFLITFTSGSTGKAKGVMHSMNNLMSSAIEFASKFQFNSTNVFYHNLPMSYMAGILNLIVLPFISGSKIIIGERFDITNAMKFWDLPIKYSANTFWFTPTILSILLKLDRGTKGAQYGLANKIIGCVGTAPLALRTKNDFQKKYGIHLYESYGLSETLFVSTNYPNNDLENSVGIPLNGTTLDFANDNEILLSVPWMYLGYVNVETESYFVNKLYLSGDLGEIKDGHLRITGRKKDVIIRGGINISPKKTEDLIYDMSIFDEITVLGLSDDYLGEKTVCFYSTKAANSMDDTTTKNLNQKVINLLGRDYQIDEFVQLEQIPKNSNGKIDKPKIREIYKQKTNVS